MSKERVESLTKLFNCEFREGRPEAAPLLRSQGLSKSTAASHDVRPDTDDENGELHPCDLPDGVCEYSIGVPEAGAHDVGVLPHMHEDSDIERLFPQAKVSPETEHDPIDYDPGGWKACRGAHLQISQLQCPQSVNLCGSHR